MEPHLEGLALPDNDGHCDYNEEEKENKIWYPNSTMPSILDIYFGKPTRCITVKSTAGKALCYPETRQLLYHYLAWSCRAYSPLNYRRGDRQRLRVGEVACSRPLENPYSDFVFSCHSISFFSGGSTYLRRLNVVKMSILPNRSKIPCNCNKYPTVL